MNDLCIIDYTAGIISLHQACFTIKKGIVTSLLQTIKNCANAAHLVKVY